MNIYNNAVTRTVQALLLLASLWILSTSVLSANEGQQKHEHSIVSRDVPVEPGDTIASIALRELGKAAFAPLLAEFNQLNITDTPEAGSVIRVPIHVSPVEEFAEVVFVKGSASITRLLSFGVPTIPVGNSALPDINQTVSRLVNPQSETTELKRNDHIVSGDQITTESDGYVSISFFSGAVINLQPDTQATLEKLACTQSADNCVVEINTQRGRVSADINARAQQPLEFTINTPYASAAVRGTIFDVDANEKLLIGVTEGGVAISASGDNVDLDTGFGLAVEQGQAPGEPIPLIAAPVFKRIPARIALGDTLEWWPFDEAESYRAILSTDEAAQQTLTEFDVVDTVVDVAQSLSTPVDVGDYFLTVRAIDTNGLLGFRSNTRITLASIDESLEPVNTQVQREGNDFLVSVIDPPDDALGFEMQISSDEQFSDPISVDVNSSGLAIFRIDQDEVFSRARILVDPVTVSAFGEPSSN